MLKINHLDLTIEAKNILNKEAEIIVGKSLNITTQNLQNIRASMPLNLRVIYGRDYEVVEDKRVNLRNVSGQSLDDEGDSSRGLSPQEKAEALKQEALKVGKVSNENLRYTRRGYWIYSYTLTKTLTPEYASNYTSSLFSNTPTLILAGGNANIQVKDTLLNQSFLGFRGNTNLKAHTFTNAKDATLSNNANLSLQAHKLKNEGEIRGENLNATLHTLENIAGRMSFRENVSLRLQSLKNQGITNQTYSQRWVGGRESALILENIPQEDLREPRNSLEAQMRSRKNGNWNGTPPEYIAGSELLSSNAPSFKASLEVRGNLNIEAKEILNQEADILVGRNLQISTQTLNNTKAPQYGRVAFRLNHLFEYSKKPGKLKPWGWAYDTASAQGSTNQLFYSASKTSILVGGNANIRANKIGNGEILDNHQNTQYTKASTTIAFNPLLNFLIPALNNTAFSRGKSNATPVYSLNIPALNNSLANIFKSVSEPLISASSGAFFPLLGRRFH